jgi:hypothetical protein
LSILLILATLSGLALPAVANAVTDKRVTVEIFSAMTKSVESGRYFDLVKVSDYLMQISIDLRIKTSLKDREICAKKILEGSVSPCVSKMAARISTDDEGDCYVETEGCEMRASVW